MLFEPKKKTLLWFNDMNYCLFDQTMFSFYLLCYFPRKLIIKRSQLPRISDMAMESALISSVPTIASRFALLQLESDTDSEPGKGRSGRRAGKSLASGCRSINVKKREKRRKRREQQQSEANDVKGLYFQQ